MSNLPVSEYGIHRLKKRNRRLRQTPKKHEIKKVSGRSTLELQRQIQKKAEAARRKREK